jgi:DNA modification methylase
MNNPAINTTEQNLPFTPNPLSLVPGGKAPLQQQLVRLEESNRQKLALNLIKTDGGTRTRIQINHAVTAQYAKEMERGVLFFPVTVFFDGETYWLADGFYRVAAAKQAGKISISAYIKPGGQREANLYAMTANKMHGNPLTSRDKRNAARMLLTDSEWNMWSNRKLAKQAECSEGAIRRYKKELEQEHESALEAQASAKKTQSCQYSKNGKTYFMKTDRLKKKSAQPVLSIDVLAALTGLPVLDDSFQVAGLLKLPVSDQMEIASILAENQVQNRVLTFSDAVAALNDKRAGEQRDKLISDALQAGYDNHFVNGDCVEVLNTTDLLQPGSVRLLLADGPYGIGFAKHGTSTSLICNDKTLKEALDVHRDMLAAIEPYMMPDCHIMLFCDKRFEPEFRQVAAEAGYQYKDSLIWDKEDAGRPIPNQAMRRHERIIWYTKGNPEVYGNMPDVLVYPRPNKKRTGSHPTPKSIPLLSRLVEATTVEGELLADTFAGSGTTLIAAKTLGRKYFGVEQDPEWYRQAMAELNSAAQGQSMTSTSSILVLENLVGSDTHQEPLSSVA